MTIIDRRAFLQRCALALGALAALPVRVRAQGPEHPTPRPGITGDRILTAEQLARTPRLIPLFDAIRAIPEVVDGIRCNCGCASLPGFHSLLSCFEAEGMARECAVCQGQGRLVVRLHREGKSLDEIRAAVDAKFG